MTDAGLRADAFLTRTGVFQYQLPDGSVRRELRHPDDVFDSESLASLEMVPVTREHPSELIRRDNAKTFSVGWVGDQVVPEDGKVRSSIMVVDEDAIADIQDGKRREISGGYRCDILDEQGEYEGERYDARQTKIRYNHVALVTKGRAGPEVCVKFDAAEEVNDLDVAQQRADEVEELQKEIEELKARLDAAEKRASAAESDRDKAQARADGLEDKIKAVDVERQDDEDTECRVRELARQRSDLIVASAKVLDSDEGLHELSDREIREKVILAASPEAKLDGKSDDYIVARFDAAIESAKPNEGLAQARVAAANAVKADSQKTAKTARQKMIERNHAKWQRKAE